ncbi:MAG TPA: hypothetical protein VLX91_17015 [Candidatus Acidoferrales bacterium]|nr:hypothetical protein [Candidatus Acidoferrales bacterium]
MKELRRIEIWFFIGALLTVYGILIVASGIYYWLVPLAHQVALSDLHSDIWWGALLLVLGLIYAIKYWPFRTNKGTET